MSRFAVFFLANKRLPLLGRVPISLGGDITISTIDAEIFGLISRKYQNIHESFSAGDKVIKLSDEIKEDDILRCLLACAFSLNCYADKDPFGYSRGFWIEKLRRTKVLGECNGAYEEHSRANLGEFKFSIDADIPRIETIYLAVKLAIEKDPTLKITIGRFTRAISGSNFADNIIDIAISLESLITSSTEISFKFALYLSLISTKDIAEREENFALLKKLYEKRSAIVHGRDVDFNEIQLNWEKILRMTKFCILYKSSFLEDHGARDWGGRLNSLALA